MISADQRALIFGQPGQVDRILVVTPWGLSAWCHTLIAQRFLEACKEAASDPWRPLRIDSYNPRPIRGYDGSNLWEWSMHSWALAWDFFATPPGVTPPGGVWTPANGLPESFARAFERRGFRWGGRWSNRRDVPHIEWAEDRPHAPLPAPEPEPVEVLPVVIKEIDMHKPFQLGDRDGRVYLFVENRPAISLGNLAAIHGILANKPAGEPVAEYLNADALVPAAELSEFVKRWNAS